MLVKILLVLLAGLLSIRAEKVRYKFQGFWKTMTVSTLFHV